MAKEEIFDKLKELVVDQLGVEEDEVTMEASMQDDLGADSLDLVDPAPQRMRCSAKNASPQPQTPD